VKKILKLLKIWQNYGLWPRFLAHPVYVTIHTHPFNGPFSGTTWVGRYQKGKTNLDFTEARDIEWQWHQLGHMQVCTSLQTDNHVSTSLLSFFTGRMPFLPPNQQRQSTESNTLYTLLCCTKYPVKIPGPPQLTSAQFTVSLHERQH